MAQSYPDFALSGDWQDIAVAAGYGAIANQRVTLQAKSNDVTLVYIGGAAAPAPRDGVALYVGNSLTGTSDHFWVKGRGSVAVLVED